MAKTNTIRSNSLQTNSVRLNGVEGLRRVSLQAGEIPDIPPTYTLSASVTNGKVSAKRNGSAVSLPYTANEGDTIVLSVTPNDGYAFEGWNDGNTDNPRTITMNADVALSAQCVEVVQPPVGNYIQFEDKAVEAICVANWSSDGIGLTEEDAAAVTSIGTTFKGNTAITSFNEFEYFTGVTSLTTSAFYSCSSLKAIKFPSSVTEIGVQAFYGCSALEGDLLLDNVTTIGHNAFNGCKKLTSVYAPVLGSIPQDGFRYCSGLQSVELGDAVTSIGIRGLRDCTGLQKIIVRAATPPSLLADALTSTNSCPIYVPDASLEAYKTAVNWSAYADRIHPLSEIEGNNGVTLYDRLYGDGVAYIATDYYLKGNERIDCKSQNVFVDNKSRWMFGAFDGSRITGICTGGGSNASNVQYVLYYGSDDYLAYDYIAALYDNADFFIQRTKGGWGSYAMTINGSAVGITDAPFCIFSNAKNPTYPFKGWLGSVIVTDTDTSEVLAKFTPASYNGEAGMYDEVSGKFYGNAAASGAFYVENE